MIQEVEISHESWKVNGIQMHVALAGSGSPVVLLHGFPELWYSWRGLIPRLARDHRVIAPDLRGMGRTEITDHGYDIDTLARDVTELIDMAGGPALLVGHDWGGVIGWHVATLYPDRVRGYVAVAGPHPARYLELLIRSPRQLLMSLYTFFFQVPALPERLLSSRQGALIERIMKRSAKRPGAISPADLEVYREAWSNLESMRAGINYYRALARKQLKVLRFYRDCKTPCPVRVVWGDSDPFLSIAQTAGLDKWCDKPPGINVIRDCGHWVAQEAPADLHRIILDFMAELE